MRIPNISPKAQPEVITGARGPKTARDALESSAKRNPVAHGKDKVVFQSRYANHRIQVTAPPDIKDPFTGRLTKGRPKTAQFRNNILVVDQKDDDTLTWLREHPAFGNEFWLLSDVIEAAKQRERETAARVLADPEQKAALLAELRESGDLDFTLPEADASETEAAPDSEEPAEVKGA